MRTILAVACVAFLASGAGAEELEPRKSESLTVYQQGFGLVRDLLSFQAARGEQELSFAGFAQTMRPETVAISSSGFEVLEQSFEALPITRDALIRERIGEAVYVDTWNPYQDRRDRSPARLLGLDARPIYLIDDEVHLDHPGQLVLPEWRERSPTLTWLVKSRGGNASCQLSYLVGSVQWQANYVLNLEDDQQSGSLQGWASIVNDSGADYENVQLTLVAGDIAQAEHAQAKSYMLRSAEAADFAPEQAALGDYYSYRFERRIDLMDGARKQLQFLSPELVGISKELRVRTQNNYLGRQYQESVPIAAELHYIFESGQALPAGVMRVYLQDQMMGEDRISHSAKGFEVDLNVGRSFDVRVERRQMDYHRITSKKHRSEWEIKVENAKDRQTQVIIDEVLSGDWQIIDSSQPYEKVSASTVRFRIDLGRLASAVFKYTVEVDY